MLRRHIFTQSLRNVVLLFPTFSFFDGLVLPVADTLLTSSYSLFVWNVGVPPLSALFFGLYTMYPAITPFNTQALLPLDA